MRVSSYDTSAEFYIELHGGCRRAQHRLPDSPGSQVSRAESSPTRQPRVRLSQFLENVASSSRLFPTLRGRNGAATYWAQLFQYIVRDHRVKNNWCVEMTELSVEEIQEPTPQPEEPAEPPEEPPEEPPGEPPELRREPSEVQAEEPAELPPEPPAPKRRGRPPGSKNKPKAEPKRRVRQPTLEPEPSEPPPPVDVNALLEPIFRAYMATGELRKRQARQQRYDSLFRGMVG